MWSPRLFAEEFIRKKLVVCYVPRHIGMLCDVRSATCRATWAFRANGSRSWRGWRWRRWWRPHAVTPCACSRDWSGERHLSEGFLRPQWPRGGAVQLASIEPCGDESQWTETVRWSRDERSFLQELVFRSLHTLRSGSWASEGGVKAPRWSLKFGIFAINLLAEKCCFFFVSELEKWNLSAVTPPEKIHCCTRPGKIHNWPSPRKNPSDARDQYFIAENL